MTRRPLVSVVLPVHNQANHISGVALAYAQWLDCLDLDWELLLVVNGSRDKSESACRIAARRHRGIKVMVLTAGGWGRAVRLGLKTARGGLLCYTNSARTSPQDLCCMILCAIMNPGNVVKASRKVRGALVRRAGSWLYNLECRRLLDIQHTWDVNGTPKVFPRVFDSLLKLKENGDLIDAEFNALCVAKDYPVMNVPVFEHARHGGSSTTHLMSAWRMYSGVLRLRRRLEGI